MISRTVVTLAILALAPTLAPGPAVASPPAELSDVVAEARARVAGVARHDTEIDPGSAGVAGTTLRLGSGDFAVSVELPEEPSGPASRIPIQGDRLLVASGGRSVSVNMVIAEEDPAAEYEFEFTLPGTAQLIPEVDGTVTIGEPLSDGLIAVYGEIEPAWAIDAEGEPVPTRYEVEGRTLVQVVDTTGAALPVVADPSISLGWYIYVRYSKAEVQRYWSGTDILNKAAFALACQAIPFPYSAACTVTSVQYADSIGRTFKDAKRYNQCVELRLAYVTYAVVGWKRYSC